jgi:hypothetical protein
VEDDEDEFLDFVTENKIPCLLLGHVTKARCTVDEQNFGLIADYKELYDNAIGKEMAN